MVSSCASQEVRDQSTGLCHPLLVARFRLESVDHLRVLVVVGCVVPSHRGYRARMVAAVSSIRLGMRFTIDLGGSVAVSQRCLGEHLGDVDPAAQAHALRQVGTWSGRNALEGIFARVAGGLVERSAGFVVGQVGLSRIGEEGQDGGDSLRRAGLASGDH